MLSTGRILRKMATVINTDGLHTGEQFAVRGATNRLDICAHAWCVAEDKPAPDVFFTDQTASMELLERSKPAMQALRALSASITDYKVPDTSGRPDVIEHVFNWTATPGIGQKTPPTITEIVGRLIRASESQQGTRFGFTDAHGLCTTCGGHGALTVDTEEIPYEDLSPRRKQGYDLGHRFHRNHSKPCPHCDGQDRVTDAAVSAYEASL